MKIIRLILLGVFINFLQASNDEWQELTREYWSKIETKYEECDLYNQNIQEIISSSNNEFLKKEYDNVYSNNAYQGRLLEKIEEAKKQNLDDREEEIIILENYIKTRRAMFGVFNLVTQFKGKNSQDFADVNENLNKLIKCYEDKLNGLK